METTRPLVPARQTSSTPERTMLVAASVAVLTGLAVGIGTQVLQGVLPGSWGVVANSGVAWALGAFAVGMAMPSARAGALCGATAMVLATLSYYWAVDWFEGISSGSRGALVWSVAGLVAGPAFGFAGHVARMQPDRRGVALAPVAGIFVGEGTHLLWFVGVDHLWPAGVVEVVLGATLCAVCLVIDRHRLAVLGTAAAAVAIHRFASVAIETGFAIV